MENDSLISELESELTAEKQAREEAERKVAELRQALGTIAKSLSGCAGLVDHMPCYHITANSALAKDALNITRQ